MLQNFRPFVIKIFVLSILSGRFTQYLLYIILCVLSSFQSDHFTIDIQLHNYTLEILVCDAFEEIRDCCIVYLKKHGDIGL